MKEDDTTPKAPIMPKTPPKIPPKPVLKPADPVEKEPVDDPVDDTVVRDGENGDTQRLAVHMWPRTKWVGIFIQVPGLYICFHHVRGTQIDVHTFGCNRNEYCAFSFNESKHPFGNVWT